MPWAPWVGPTFTGGVVWKDLPDETTPLDADLLNTEENAEATYAAQIGQSVYNSITGQLPDPAAIAAKPVVYVASAFATSSQRSAADFVCGGSDDDVVINNAINQVHALTPSQGVPGGRVQLLGPRFNTSRSIIKKSYVALRGEHWYFTTIRSMATWLGAANDGLIAIDNTAATEYVGVSRLCLDGNKSNQTAVVTRGLSLQCDATSGFTYNDSVWAFEWLRIIDTLGDGIWLAGPNVRANRFARIRIERPDGDGINTTAADSHFHAIDIGSAGKAGFHINGATNHRWTNSKAYFCGRLQTTPTGRSTGSVTGAGWRVEGPRNSIVACEAQDCKGHGFAVGSNDNTLNGVIADSNSYDASNVAGQRGNADGIYIEASVRVVHVDGTSFDKNEGNRGVNQNSGVFISKGAPISDGLDIHVVSDNCLNGPIASAGAVVANRSHIRGMGTQFGVIGSVSFTAGLNTATVNSTQQLGASGGGFAVGQLLFTTGGVSPPAGLPAGTTIIGVSGSTLTLSNPAGSTTTVNVLAKTLASVLPPVVSSQALGNIGAALAIDLMNQSGQVFEVTANTPLGTVTFVNVQAGARWTVQHTQAGSGRTLFPGVTWLGTSPAMGAANPASGAVDVYQFYSPDGVAIIGTQVTAPNYDASILGQSPTVVETAPRLLCAQSLTPSAGFIYVTHFRPDHDQLIASLEMIVATAAAGLTLARLAVAAYAGGGVYNVLARSANTPGMFAATGYTPAQAIADDGAAAPNPISSLQLQGGVSYAFLVLQVGTTPAIFLGSNRQAAAAGLADTSGRLTRLALISAGGQADIPSTFTTNTGTAAFLWGGMW